MREPRALGVADEAALAAFLDRVPAADRNFFKEDLDAATAAAWVRDARVHRAVTVDDGGEVRAYGAVIPGIGWSSHVGEMRLVVDPKARRRGLGRAMARWALVEAVRMGLTKLYVELVADQAAAVAMFSDIGFEGEALLRDHVRDRRGRLHDLIVLVHQVDENLASMAATGLDEVGAEG